MMQIQYTVLFSIYGGFDYNDNYFAIFRPKIETWTDPDPTLALPKL